MEKRTMKMIPLRSMGSANALKQIAWDDLVDDVLGLILERIGSHVSLIRAASTCKRWRRIISDADFLRRFRFLHAATVAGYYYNSPEHPFSEYGESRKREGPVFIPSPLLSISCHHRYHSLDFLPGGAEEWIILDSRGGLLLMGHLMPRANFFCLDLSNIIVCEPLTQRFEKIPTPPDLTSSTDHYIWSGIYLVDGKAGEAVGRIGMSNFRVFFEVYGQVYYSIPHAIVVFTTSGADTSRRSSSSWSKKFMDHVIPKQSCDGPDDYMVPSDRRFGLVLGTVAGCRYMYLRGGTLVSVDCSTGDISSSRMPTTNYSRDEHFSFYAVQGSDGKLRILTFLFSDIKVFAKIDGNWELEKSIRLAEATYGLAGYKPSFFTPQQPLRFLTSRGPGFIILSPDYERWPVLLNLETMEVAPAPLDRLGSMVYQCELPWPPAFHACLNVHGTNN